PSGMRNAKQILAIPLSFLVIVGGLCSHLCEVNCGYQGYEPAEAARLALNAVEPERAETQSGHCHQHQSESTSKSEPQQEPAKSKKDHSPNCRDHIHSATAILETKTFAAVQELLPTVAAEPVFFNYFAFDQPTGDPASYKPFRSPPTCAVH